MKIYELPEEQKVYMVQLNNKQEYKITGTEKVKIMQSKSQFIELKTGEVINKSFIVSITLLKDETKANYLTLKTGIEHTVSDGEIYKNFSDERAKLLSK